MSDDTPESSPEIQPAAAETAAPSQDAAPQGGSEPSTEQKHDESLLDRVAEAIKPKAGDSSAPKVDQPPAEGEPSKEAEPEDGDLTDEELSRLNKKTQNRIKKLVSERNAAREQLATTEPDAKAFRGIVDFFKDSGITGQEFNLLLDVGRNLKTNPEKALEQIRPYFSQLQGLVGEALPDDLVDRVQKGFLTEDDARALAKARGRTTVLESQNAERAQREQQQQQANEHKGRVEAVQRAVTDWETKESANDPDWNLKQERIKEKIKLHVLENGFPKTATDAVEMAKAAQKSVNDEFRKLNPQRKPVVPLPNSASSSAKAKPSSMVEAIQAALG